MTTDLEVRDYHAVQRVTLTNDQLQFIANTEFVPKEYRGNLPAIMACIATGRALGIDDMTALRLIHMVNGRPSFAAELMVHVVRRDGHSITGEATAEACTVVGTRKDNGDTMKVTWTMDMAARAGLANKAVWKSYPESLLWARAVSQLCRMLFADCFAGPTYTPEEIGDDGSPQATLGEPRVAAAASSPGGFGESAMVASPDVHDSAAGTPFQYDVAAPVEPAGVDADKKPTKKQNDALDSLVKQLEAEGHITVLQVWQSMGIEPRPDDYEGDRLRWSPLRDQLTRSQAHQLLDRLIPFADEKLPKGAA